MREALAAAVLLLLCGCTPHLSTGWADLAELPREPGFAPKASSVILLQEVRYLFFAELDHDSYTEHAVHEVIEIRSPKGLERASREIPLEAEGVLVEVRARTIAPDGTTVELDPDQVLGDELRDASGTSRRRVLRVPGVKVGTVIDLSYVVRRPGGITAVVREASGPSPVRRYEVELRGSRGIGYAFKVEGSEVPIVRVDDGKDWRIGWSLRDLPARPRVSYAPHPPERGAWWAYRQQSWRAPFVPTNIFRSWGDAARIWSRRLEISDARLREGFQPDVTLAGCAAPRCRVDRALEWVRQRTDLSDVEKHRVRPLAEILSSGHASSLEKSVLLRETLAALGVEARLALVPRAGGRLDRKFPLTEHFDHLFVRVPSQGELPALWLDPSCEHCSAGEIASVVEGGEALVFQAEGRPEEEAAWEPVDATLLESATAIRRYRGALQPDGTATLQLVVEKLGAVAAEERLRIRTHDGSQAQADAEEIARSRSPAGVGRSVVAGSCEKLPPVCRSELELRLPGHAVADGDRLLVPLSVFGATKGKPFDRKRRKEAIVFRRVHDDLEELTLELPAGYAVEQLPAPRTLGEGRVAAALTARTEGTTVVVRRELHLAAGRHEAADYPALRKLVDDYEAIRSEAIVLVRSPSP